MVAFRWLLSVAIRSNDSVRKRHVQGVGRSGGGSRESCRVNEKKSAEPRFCDRSSVVVARLNDYICDDM